MTPIERQTIEAVIALLDAVAFLRGGGTAADGLRAHRIALRTALDADVAGPVTKTYWPKESEVMPPETQLRIEISHQPSYRLTTVKDINRTYDLAQRQAEKIKYLRDQMTRMNYGYRRKIARLERKVVQLCAAINADDPMVFVRHTEVSTKHSVLATMASGADAKEPTKA